MSNKVTINIGDKNYEYSVIDGSVGPSVVDLRSFYSDTGMFTYDPGFTSTGSCESKITFIDGENGILLHRGYPIEQLAEKCNFEEVAYLLLHSELPNTEEKLSFEHDLTYHSMLHEQIHNFFSGFRRDAHPMAIMYCSLGLQIFSWTTIYLSQK